MSRERTTNEIIESVTGLLISIAKREDKQEIESATAIMEVGWAKMDEFDYNKELANIWRKSHKTA